MTTIAPQARSERPYGTLSRHRLINKLRFKETLESGTEGLRVASLAPLSGAA
jgi:hypothetical protein